MSDDTTQKDGRRETHEEKLDRNWADLLQELRVSQTGVQFMAGFLLTLPFQEAFKDLSGRQEAVYLGLVTLACVTIGLTLAPISVHRKLFRGHVKDRLIASTHRITQAVLVAISVLVTGIVFFVFDVVTGLTGALVAAGGLAVFLVLILLLLPAAVDKD